MQQFFRLCGLFGCSGSFHLGSGSSAFRYTCSDLCILTGFLSLYPQSMLFLCPCLCIQLSLCYLLNKDLSDLNIRDISTFYHFLPDLLDKFRSQSLVLFL